MSSFFIRSTGVVRLLCNTILCRNVKCASASSVKSVIVIYRRLRCNATRSSFFSAIFCNSSVLRIRSCLIRRNFIRQFRGARIMVNCKSPFIFLYTLCNAYNCITCKARNSSYRIFAFLRFAPFACKSFFRQAFPIRWCTTSTKVTSSRQAFI